MYVFFLHSKIWIWYLVHWYYYNRCYVGVTQVDVIVNSASSDLDLSKNASAKALSNAAGSTLQQECKAIGKVNTGDIVVTSGGKLDCKHVFHTSCAAWNQQSGEQVHNILDIKGQVRSFWFKFQEKSVSLETQTFNRIIYDGGN